MHHRIDYSLIFKEVENYLITLQQCICDVLQQENDNDQSWLCDDWNAQHGHGKTFVLEGGSVLERVGVSFSSVSGDNLPQSASKRYPKLVNQPFRATGLSLVIHPNNPYVPTSHMNLRFFLTQTSEKKPVWWFGGGFDLTPYYGFHEDCQHWHRQALKACQPFGEKVYPRFKAWCDHYFYLKHRQEPRGIGGLFFDDLNQWPIETCMAFLQSVGDHYLPAYQPIVHHRKDTPYTQREKNFQHHRRGRYVEFNLIYDRGTLFGLQFGGRIESILMSLPPQVCWSYCYNPIAGSPEAELYEEFLKAKDWLE